MVPRPESTTPEDRVEIKILTCRIVGSEGTFTTGHGARDDHEGYEEQFAFLDVAPGGATRTSTQVEV
ncbi:hypothetical protein PHMEG_0004806 [Phytophthora megakarya]|uniref:Uncharacterized protein n=1 Tax=Phytophthora megakarya TaxID=4795 RepID=A0A225WSY0_9STRA|nr:hypothetical protein PHMEG_0004806 [Phytophthora megakarya]